MDMLGELGVVDDFFMPRPTSFILTPGASIIMSYTSIEKFLTSYTNYFSFVGANFFEFIVDLMLF